ncbi:hypothetical protein PJ201_21830, partial [Escherichia coli]|nr:hypothetical protein [Escherichia coli]
LNRLIRCVCGKKIGPDPRNFNQRVSLGRNDLLIRTFLGITRGINARKNKLILTRRNHSAGIKLLSYKLIQINPGYLLYLSPVIRYSSS